MVLVRSPAAEKKHGVHPATRGCGLCGLARRRMPLVFEALRSLRSIVPHSRCRRADGSGEEAVCCGRRRATQRRPCCRQSSSGQRHCSVGVRSRRPWPSPQRSKREAYLHVLCDVKFWSSGRGEGGVVGEDGGVGNSTSTRRRGLSSLRTDEGHSKQKKPHGSLHRCRSRRPRTYSNGPAFSRCLEGKLSPESLKMGNAAYCKHVHGEAATRQLRKAPHRCFAGIAVTPQLARRS